jgi:hypothetical protein
MKLLAEVKALVADPLFLRVCTALWSMPFVALGVGIAMGWHPDGLWEWLGFLGVELICLYFAYLLFVSLFGSDTRIAQSSGVLADGGDLPGLVLVVALVLVALPITLLIKAVLGRRH